MKVRDHADHKKTLAQRRAYYSENADEILERCRELRNQRRHNNNQAAAMAAMPKPTLDPPGWILFRAPDGAPEGTLTGTQISALAGFDPAILQISLTSDHDFVGVTWRDGRHYSKDYLIDSSATGNVANPTGIPTDLIYGQKTWLGVLAFGQHNHGRAWLLPNPPPPEEVPRKLFIRAVSPWDPRTEEHNPFYHQFTPFAGGRLSHCHSFMVSFEPAKHDATWEGTHLGNGIYEWVLTRDLFGIYTGTSMARFMTQGFS